MNPKDFARVILRERDEARRARYAQTRIPPGFPPAFESLAEYLGEIRSVRDAMRDADATDVAQFVYVVMPKPLGMPHVKIGYSNLPERRVSDMQVASPTSLSLIGKRRCPVVHFDRRIHDLIPTNDRAKGEWFRASDWVRWVLDVLELVRIPNEPEPVPDALLAYRDPRAGAMDPIDTEIMAELTASLGICVAVSDS